MGESRKEGTAEEDSSPMELNDDMWSHRTLELISNKVLVNLQTKPISYVGLFTLPDVIISTVLVWVPSSLNLCHKER